MRRFSAFILTAAALASPAAPGTARAAPDHRPPPLEISMPGDADMDCARIGQEVGMMDQLIAGSYSTREKSDQTSIGVNVVKTIGSVLVGTLTGTIGFMAAGHLAAEAADHRSEVAEETGEIALQRRSLMVGMFQAKQCEGDLPAPPSPPRKIWPRLMDPASPADAAQAVEPAAGEAPGESGAAAGNEAPRPPMRHETRRYND